MIRTRQLLVLAVLMVVMTAPVMAITIKLASVAPEQSPWGTALNRLALEWGRISNGRVDVRIYHNGIAGNEDDIIRKMRINQLQAGVFTSAGMKSIAPEAFALSVPFLIREEDELRHVLQEVQPELDAAFQANRMHALAWSRAGWVHFFSKEPVTYPQDLKEQRLAADPNDQELLQAFRIMGYRPIPMPQNELLTSLNSGLVDAFYTSPLVAAGFQWFGLAPHMLNLKVAPFLGVIVISDTAWRRIPEDIKPQLLRSAANVALQIEDQVLQLEEQAIDLMEENGLMIGRLSEAEQQVWIEDFEEHSTQIMEDVFHPEMTARIQSILSEYRSR